MLARCLAVAAALAVSVSASGTWTQRDRQTALALAAAAARAAVLGSARPTIPSRLPQPLTRPAGAFVTLLVDGRTRGCMGSLEPHERTLAEQIATSAFAAATSDPYHLPVRASELPRLRYQIAVVLDRPWAASGESELRPSYLGLCVRAGARVGVMLPGEARTARYQLQMARRKAGLKLGEPAALLLFRVLLITGGAAAHTR
jgi:AMMECR1 domain-containing protein